MPQIAESKHGFDDSPDSEAKKGRLTVITDMASEYKVQDVDQSKEYIRRNAKWYMITKPNNVLGFDPLQSAPLPIVGPRARGICLCLEKIVGWKLPIHQFPKINSVEEIFVVQLSFSLFHFQSKSFFGTTWIGSQINLTEGQESLPAIIDVDYNDLVYLMTRVTDPSCIGIVEIIISQFNTKKNVKISQFGFVNEY